MGDHDSLENLAAPPAEPATTATHSDVTRLATGATVSLAGKMTGRGLHTLGQIALARLLGPAGFGLYAIGWTVLRLLRAVAPLGLDNGVIRYAPRYWRRDAAGLQAVLLQSLGLSLLSGVLLGAALFLAAPWLSLSVFHSAELIPVIRLFAFAVPVSTLLRVAAAATRVSQRMQQSVYSEELGQPASNLLFIGLVALVGGRLLGAVAAGVASFAVALALALYYVWKIFPESFPLQPHRPRLAAELIRFSVPASLAGIFTLLIIWADRLIVGYFRPAAEVGIYQAASQSAVLLALVLTSFNAIFTPMIVHLYDAGQTRRLEELFRLSTKWGLYVSVPAFLVMCSAPRELMSVVFGSAYEMGWAPLIVLGAGQLVNAGTGPVGMLMIMTGHQGRWFALSGVVLMLNIVLIIALIPPWGLVGAAVATSLAVSTLFLCGLVDVRRTLGLWPYDRRYRKGLLATVAAAAALWALRLLPLGSAGLRLLLTLVISGGVFSGILWVTGLDPEDRQFLALIRSRLQSGRGGV